MVSEQNRPVLHGPAHPCGPLCGDFFELVFCEYALACLLKLPRIPARGLALRRHFVTFFTCLAEVPGVVRRGDRRVPSVPDDVDDPGLRVDPGDLLHGLRGEQRRLVAYQPLVSLGELAGEEVVDGHSGEVGQVLLCIVVPAPDRPFYPEPQVLGVEHRVVERAGRPPGVDSLDGLLPPAPAEEATLALAQYLWVGVEDLHQPGCSGLLVAHDEEGRRARGTG